jgi:xylan 1,4-beta-xylosidase
MRGLRSARPCAAVLATAALAAAPLSIPGQAQAFERTIAADMMQVDGARDMFWQDCIGADHPGILLRRDNLAQLRTTHEQLGFKYIRFHGIFA